MYSNDHIPGYAQVDLRDRPLRILAKVTQGNRPVMEANVRAYIGEGNEVELKDDGGAADLIANDGIYSSYLTGIESRGR